MRAKNINPNINLVADSQRPAQKAVELFASNARKAIETMERFCAAISRCTLELYGRL